MYNQSKFRVVFLSSTNGTVCICVCVELNIFDKTKRSGYLTQLEVVLLQTTFYFQNGQQHGFLMKQVEIKKAGSTPLSIFQEICVIVRGLINVIFSRELGIFLRCRKNVS